MLYVFCLSYPGDLIEPLLHQLCGQLLDPLLIRENTKDHMLVWISQASLISIDHFIPLWQEGCVPLL